MKTNYLNTLMFLLLLAGTILLQIYLSRRPSKWPGLVLPAISGILSLTMPMGVLAVEGSPAFSAVITALFSFLIANIPTLVLLAIYYASREKYRQEDLIKKMKIQDL